MEGGLFQMAEAPPGTTLARIHGGAALNCKHALNAGQCCDMPHCLVQTLNTRVTWIEEGGMFKV